MSTLSDKLRVAGRSQAGLSASSDTMLQMAAKRTRTIVDASDKDLDRMLQCMTDITIIRMVQGLYWLRGQRGHQNLANAALKRLAHVR